MHCVESENELPGSQALNAKKVSADCTMVDRGCSDLHEGKNHGADFKKNVREIKIYSNY